VGGENFGRSWSPIMGKQGGTLVVPGSGSWITLPHLQLKRKLRVGKGGCLVWNALDCCMSLRVPIFSYFLSCLKCICPVIPSVKRCCTLSPVFRLLLCDYVHMAVTQLRELSWSWVVVCITVHFSRLLICFLFSCIHVQLRENLRIVLVHNRHKCSLPFSRP
jgi:hypothetical protein